MQTKLINDKKKIDEIMEGLKEAEEEEKKEIQEIKKTVESKKDEIINFIVTNITNVDLKLPEVIKIRKKKKIAKQ